MFLDGSLTCPAMRVLGFRDQGCSWDACEIHSIRLLLGEGLDVLGRELDQPSDAFEI